MLTSEEGVLERVSVKDPEAVRSAYCEATMVLVETHIVYYFGGQTALGSLHKGCVIDNG